MRIRLLAVFLTVIFLPLSFGLAQTTASLDSIPARMHDVIAANEVPGAVTVVATRDSVLRMDAQGWADAEHRSFMRVDSIFWIASMSKPITATAVLMLMEEGKLSLDDPIVKYFQNLLDSKLRMARRRESRCGTCSLTPPEWEKQPTKRRKPRARWPT